MGSGRDFDLRAFDLLRLRSSPGSFLGRHRDSFHTKIRWWTYTIGSLVYLSPVPAPTPARLLKNEHAVPEKYDGVHGD